MSKTKYFLDTEFIEDGHTIDLVSVGVACEDGREFYAEVIDPPWHKADSWVLANVRPHLIGGDCEMTRPQIRSALLAFIGHNKPEIWGYYADYDWVVICRLFGRMTDLPAGWPMFCMDLKQLTVSIGNPRLPEQTSTEHHALEDARWNLSTWRWLTSAARCEAGAVPGA